jgi:hypothetical protein
MSSQRLVLLYFELFYVVLLQIFYVLRCNKLTFNIMEKTIFNCLPKVVLLINLDYPNRIKNLGAVA